MQSLANSSDSEGSDNRLDGMQAGRHLPLLLHHLLSKDCVDYCIRRLYQRWQAIPSLQSGQGLEIAVAMWSSNFQPWVQCQRCSIPFLGGRLCLPNRSTNRRCFTPPAIRIHLVAVLTCCRIPVNLVHLVHVVHVDSAGPSRWNQPRTNWQPQIVLCITMCA